MCPAPRVLPLRATERPTKGTYGIGAIWKTWRYGMIKPTILPQHHIGADGATFRQKFRRQGLFWFFQSLTAGYKLPGRVRQRATSLSAIQLFPIYCSLTRALSRSLAHAQQLHARPNISAEGLHFSAFHFCSVSVSNHISTL